jgi:hypothetical protein
MASGSQSRFLVRPLAGECGRFDGARRVGITALLLVAVMWLPETAKSQAGLRPYERDRDPALGFNVVSFQPNAETTDTWSDAVDQIKQSGFEDVALVPTAYFDETGAFQAPEFQGALARLGPAIARAVALGMTVTVVPMIEPAGHTFWRGTYDPSTSAPNPEAFWRGWRTYVIAAATLAESNGARRLALGSELSAITRNPAHAKRLRELITATAGVFRGQIGYCANWENEFDRPEVMAAIWRHPAIAFLGVDAYFPLAAASDRSGPYPDQALITAVKERWNTILDERIMTVARSARPDSPLPIVLCEVGLSPFRRTLTAPWADLIDQPVDEDERLNGFHGLLEALAGRGTQIHAVHWWHFGTAASADSVYYLHPTEGNDREGSRFDESLGRRAFMMLARFVQSRSPS